MAKWLRRCGAWASQVTVTGDRLLTGGISATVAGRGDWCVAPGVDSAAGIYPILAVLITAAVGSVIADRALPQCASPGTCAPPWGISPGLRCLLSANEVPAVPRAESAALVSFADDWLGS